MNIYEEADYPWLAAEKTFIASTVDAGKALLGICLGAQLLADVLGGPVTKGEHREIGWFPVELTEAGRALPVFAGFPNSFPVLHWHGDTFAIPPGAAHTASSAACVNQAFAFDGGRVAGLQFHLEETRESLTDLVENARHELVDGPWIATAAQLLAADAPFAQCHDLLFALLDEMMARQSDSAKEQS
jgi:GMP synthase (glutamine-hydrolysing)